MSVIFDEINATVEPPEFPEMPDGARESADNADNNDGGFEEIERRLAREQWLRERLRAD
jgi:hypothetical protein